MNGYGPPALRYGRPPLLGAGAPKDLMPWEPGYVPFWQRNQAPPPAMAPPAMPPPAMAPPPSAATPPIVPPNAPARPMPGGTPGIANDRPWLADRPWLQSKGDPGAGFRDPSAPLMGAEPSFGERLKRAGRGVGGFFMDQMSGESGAGWGGMAEGLLAGGRRSYGPGINMAEAMSGGMGLARQAREQFRREGRQDRELDIREDYYGSLKNKAAKREIRADVNGRPRYVDTGELVYGDVEPEPDENVQWKALRERVAAIMQKPKSQWTELEAEQMANWLKADKWERLWDRQQRLFSAGSGSTMPGMPEPEPEGPGIGERVKGLWEKWGPK